MNAFSLSTAALAYVVQHAVPIALRVAALLSFAPFFGNIAIPIRFKAVITFVVTALLYPICAVPAALYSPTQWARIALGELALGLAMALAVQFVFEAVQLAGQVMGFQFAFSLVNIIDPQTNVDTPVLSIFQQLLATLMFLALDVHHWVLRGVAKSFEYVPVGSIEITSTTARALFQAASGMWLAGVQMALPVLLVTLLIDVTVGFLSKASPQLPVLTLSVPLKSAIGYAVLAFVAVGWSSFFERQFAAALGWSQRLLQLAK